MTSFSDDGHFGQHDPAHPEGAADSETGVAVAGPPTQLSPEQIRESLADKFVCPYCGSTNDSEQGTCPRCAMENNPATRKATKSRIGPWYVLQTRNPAAPGMKFETLLSFAHKGRIKPRSVVRGPTTHQLWKFAAHVKGLSREFGVCYSCGGQIEPVASVCPQCNRSQDPPANPDALLETKDAPTPAQPSRSRKFNEPDLAEVDAEFVVPTLGAVSEDSVSGVTLTGSMAGVAFNPDSWVPPRRNVAPTDSGRIKPDEGFLSPKDLAAAFNLNFTPAPAGDVSRLGGVAPRSRPARPQRPQQPAARPVSPAERTTPVRSRAQQPTDDPDLQAVLTSTVAPPQKPSRFRLVKALLFLIIFSAGIAAAALYYDPTLRQQGQGWLSASKATLARWQGSGNDPGGGTGKADLPLPRPTRVTNPADADTATTNPSMLQQNARLPDQPATPRDDDHGGASTPPVLATAPAVVDPPPVTPIAVIKPAPAPVVPPEPALAPPAHPVAPSVDTATASAEARRLYREALSLEVTDPAKALAAYRSIKQLPQDVWPTDLDVLIKRTETRLRLQ